MRKIILISRWRLLFYISLVATFCFTRFVELSNLPLFVDEAFVILEAKKLHEGGNIFGMVEKNTQPIFIWMVSIFQFLPMELAMSGRIVSGLCGLVTAGLLTLLARKYIGRKSSAFIFILMMLVPFSLFHDRTILFESATLLWMTSALMFSLMTPLAILAKQTGWLILPLVLFQCREKHRTMLLTLLITITIPLSIWLFSVGSISKFSSTVFRQQQHLSFEIDSVRIKNNLFRTKMWLEIYITIPIICLAVIGWIADTLGVVWKKKLTFLTALGAWSLFVISFEAIVARTFYPRYLYPLLIPIILLATNGLSSILFAIEKTVSNKTGGKIAKFFVLLLCLYPAIKLDRTIIFDPQRAPIAAEDHFQFFEDWTSGIGADEISIRVEEFVKQKGLPVSVYTESDNSYLATLLDDRNLKGVKIETAGWLTDPLRIIPDSILQEKGETLFIRNLNPDIPSNWQTEELLSINKTQTRKVVLYRVVK